MNTAHANTNLVDLAIRNQRNLTAFSALPDAPVLAYVPRRRRLAGLARQVSALDRLRHRSSEPRRPVPA
jgi:hypothetical protein